jgi:hypothetical protein
LLKSILIAALQKEILQHDFSHFVDDAPSIAQGGRGVVVAGCPQWGGVARGSRQREKQKQIPRYARDDRVVRCRG